MNDLPGRTDEQRRLVGRVAALIDESTSNYCEGLLVYSTRLGRVIEPALIGEVGAPERVGTVERLRVDVRPSWFGDPYAAECAVVFEVRVFGADSLTGGEAGSVDVVTIPCNLGDPQLLAAVAVAVLKRVEALVAFIKKGRRSCGT